MAKEKTLGVVIRKTKAGINFRVLSDKQGIPGSYYLFGWMQGEGVRDAASFLSDTIENRAREIMNIA